MAAKTTRNTAKKAGRKAPPSSKRPSVSSKTALSLRNLRIKQQLTQRLPRLSARRLIDLQEQSRLDRALAWNLCAANAQRLLRLESLCTEIADQLTDLESLLHLKYATASQALPGA